MPRPVNNFQLTGTLCKDPEVTVIDRGGKPLKIAKFSLAFDWWHGKRLQKAWFFDFVCFGYTADAAEKFLKKGKRILVTQAYIEPQAYEGKDGIKRKKWSIVADDFVLLGYNDKVEGKAVDDVMEELVDDDEIPY